MQLESSLTLLGLTPDATIDDANQAYAKIHREIDRFHANPKVGNPGDRQEDIELLTCAYEKAVAFLSKRDCSDSPDGKRPSIPSDGGEKPGSQDLHFTINFPTSKKERGTDDVNDALASSGDQTIEEAISISLRRLHETESALPEIQEEVDAAAKALEKANRCYDSAKQASFNAVVAAKSAKTRALLLELEAKQACQEAKAVAKRAKDRADAAKQAAETAREQAAKARDHVWKVRKSEDTAAAEAVCAEDRLEKEKARLKTMVHALVEAKKRVAMFQHRTAPIKDQGGTASSSDHANGSTWHGPASRQAISEAAEFAHLSAEMNQITASLQKKKISVPEATGDAAVSKRCDPAHEKRKHPRITYPNGAGPVFSTEGRFMPILDLSEVGMRLDGGGDVLKGILRGSIDFADHPSVKVTGKVMRSDSSGTGLRLVTRLGNHILDRERSRLSA